LHVSSAKQDDNEGDEKGGAGDCADDRACDPARAEAVCWSRGGGKRGACGEGQCVSV